MLPPATSVVLSSRGRGWRGLEAELRRAHPGPTRAGASRSLWLGIHHGPPVNARCRCEGVTSHRVQVHGDIDVIPPGAEGEWEDDAPCTILRIGLAEPVLDAATLDLGMDPERVSVAPRLQLRDPRLERVCWALEAELEEEMEPDPLYAESLGAALAVRLLGVARVDGARPLPGRFDPRQRDRVLDYVESHLDQRLSLADLAAVAGTGVTRFKQLFRESMGIPAHQYVLRRRVERARTLLLDGAMPASQIALEAGFSHQSHLARAMRRLLGVTPGALAGNRRDGEPPAQP